MICWNENAQKIIVNYFNSIREKWKPPFNFLLLDWAENVGKTSIIKQHAKTLLWEYFKNDFMFIKDLSEIIGKKHTLKVDVDPNDQIYISESWKRYLDLWTRQIIEWINKYPLWKYKILLLENIERMTISASNAFLKTFEECMDNVIIIATSSSKYNILDTILSRAFIIKFELPSNKIVTDCLKWSFPELSEEKINLISSFSMNRIWFAKRLIQKLSWQWEFWDLINLFERYIHLSEKAWEYHEKIKILIDVSKTWLLNVFLDALIFYYNKQKQFEKIDNIINTKKLIETNVWMENALFNMVIGN